MNTKMLGWCVAAIAIAALVAVLLSSRTKNPKEGEGITPVVEEPQTDGARPPEKKETPPEETVMGSSVTAPDVKGLPSEPQKMKGLLAQITVRILGRADDIETMKNEMLAIQRLAHVISTEGEEMILPGLEESDYVGTIYERP